MIGRDHLDTGSVASPNRETEGMRDGSDAIADWPILNALLNASAGATWVSLHHGGGVGIGYSIHAGMVIVADGTREADERLRARADVRPGDRRRAARRRRISGSDSHGSGARSANSDGGDTAMMAPHAGLERRVLAALEAAPPRIPVVLGGCGSGRTTALHALVDRLGRDQCQYIDVERSASTPERFLHALTSQLAVPRHGARPRAPNSAREAFDHTLAYFARARAGDRPATFLLDEVLELRTFESFPGLRHVLRELLQALLGERQPLRADLALRRARASAAARRHGALRGDSPAGALARPKCRACCRRWATPPPRIASS